MIITPDTDEITDAGWSERRWQAAQEHLGAVVKNELDDDAPLDARTNLVHYAERRAAQVVSQNGSEPPGPAAQKLLDALAAVEALRPRDVPAPKRVPAVVRSQAILASRLAADPASADAIPATMVPALDAVLGLVSDDRNAPLAVYFAAVADAREALAEACEKRLGWISVEHRRAVNAPTRAEAAALLARDQMNGVLA